MTALVVVWALIRGVLIAFFRAPDVVRDERGQTAGLLHRGPSGLGNARVVNTAWTAAAARAIDRSWAEAPGAKGIVLPGGAFIMDAPIVLGSLEGVPSGVFFDGAYSVLHLRHPGPAVRVDVPVRQMTLMNLQIRSRPQP